MLKKQLINLNMTAIGPAPALIKKIKDLNRFTVTLKYHEVDMNQVFKIIEETKSENIRVTFYPTLDMI
jgi:hypothetical protein